MVWYPDGSIKAILLRTIHWDVHGVWAAWVFLWLGWWVVRGIYVRRERGKDVRLVDGRDGTIGGAYRDCEMQFRYQI